MSHVSEPSPGRTGRVGRVRARAGSAVAQSSSTTKLGALAVIAVLVSAPFGGLRESATAAPGTLRTGVPTTVGPFEVTVKKIVSLEDLAPAVSPQPGDRLLVIDAVVANISSRPEYAALLINAFRGPGAGAVPFPDQDVAMPKLFRVADASELNPTQFLNPGLSQEVALVLEQGPDATAGPLTLYLDDYSFQTDDPLTLDDDRWVPDGTTSSGTFAVERK